jgi:hypothetical protein
MAITVKHNKVSTVPDGDDTSVVRPSDWNADHTLVGTIDVPNGGTGASTLTGYVKGNGTSAMTASATIPSGDVTGLGTMSTQNANAVAITGGTINGTTIGATTASTGRFSDLTDTGLTSGRITYATTGGNLTDSANLTFNGTTLVANDITDSSLTSGRVTYAGTGGNLRDASNFTYDGTNLVAGAIQNTPIGSTTPSSIVGTTITGQTGVLRGTGTNLLLQSQTFDNASWTKSNTTITAASITAPDGTLTGQTFTAVASGPTYFVTQNTTVASLTQTFSIYLKAGTITSVQLYCYATSGGANNYTATFNISAGTVTSSSATGTATLSSATITSVGNGWYRCILAGSVNFTGSLGNVIYTANGNFYAWGSQLEVGNTANTYIPTTTTAVYGTPTLSFSGVSTLGLESNGALFLQPAGTGAIQAQATTSTTAGGNVRGANAVDWQTIRGAASQVASTYSVIGGGSGNTSSGYASTTAGGESNTNTAYNGFIGAGSANTLGGNAQRGAIVGGVSNTANGYLNFIGAGAINSGTSGSAVTTQSGTMNGTTAVTLSGSNANIKVGQLIQGTSINNFPYTYVAAISGTSLTLSQNASGSSTSTLSFFTPHGVVVGGGNNQATGSYSFIGGGGDAGTAANRNVASGDWSFVGGGTKNTASGLASVVAGGGTDGTINGNTASGIASFVGGGVNNRATNIYACVVGGTGNLSSGYGSTILGGASQISNGTLTAVLGGQFATTRSIGANIIFGSGCPISYSQGVSQAGLLILGKQTTDATATVLTSEPNAASTTNQVILPNNSAYYFKIEVIAGVTGAGNTKAWELKGAIKRGANAASTVIVGTVTNTVIATDAGAATWTLTATADTTNGGIAVTATGQASTTIRWVARVTTTEMTY